MLRQAPYDKIGQTPTPKYTNANPQTGDQGSIPNAETFNQLQFEGENLVALGGLTGDGANLFQWTQAVSRGGIWVGNLTGTGDLAVATVPIPNSGTVLPALLQGMRVAGVATATNTGTSPKLRVLNLGASPGLYIDFPILKADGSGLAASEIKAGRIYRFEADGVGNVIISGGGISAGGFVNELTYLTKTAKQTLSAAATETDITWNVPGTAPSWATFNGVSLTVTQKCRVMSLLSVVAAVSNSAAGYSESDIHLALNGTDIEGTGQSAWPNTNTTFIPYLKLTSVLDLNVGDVLRSRAVVNSANYNGGYLLGTDGSYGITEQSTNWRLLCLSKG